MSNENSESGWSRREFIAAAIATPIATAASASPATVAADRAAKTFPGNFLWGAATSSYQTEGNNIGSDIWVLEHVTPTIYAEPCGDACGDACDHYHLYAADIRMLKQLGFNTYRLSLEWSRIEPEPGFFSTAELDHYRRVLALCHELDVTPMVTFNHFTTPRWFAARGGWENDKAADLFARFCERAARHLGDLISYATTFNEPNLGKLLRWYVPQDAEKTNAMLRAAARATGSEHFSFPLYGDFEKMQAVMLPAHQRARAALKSGPGDYPVGISIAVGDEQPMGEDSRIEEIRADLYEPWFRAAAQDDFIGIQVYTRARIDRRGIVPPAAGAPLTQMFYEYYPESLEHAVRYTASRVKVPIYITENGVGTADDHQRIDFIRRALAGLHECVREGIDVRGYVHWSLLDNFEWGLGYKPTFGLVAVDRATQKRTLKPSAHYLGGIAKRNGLA